MVSIRSATLQDAIHLYLWRIHPSTRTMMRETGDIRWEDHLAWLKATLDNPDRYLFVGLCDGQPVGTARLDVEGTEAEISVTVAPECRGAGVGSELIRVATQQVLDNQMVTKVMARIKPENVGSLRAFAKAGYVVVSESESEAILTFKE